MGVYQFMLLLQKAASTLRWCYWKKMKKQSEQKIRFAVGITYSFRELSRASTVLLYDHIKIRCR